MTTATLLPQGRQRYFDNNGTPCAGGRLYTYAAGTTNPKAAYTNAAGTIAHPNPITLDAKGEAVIYWSGAYKVDVKAADGTQVSGYPVDNLSTDPAGLEAAIGALGGVGGGARVSTKQLGAGAVTRTVEDVLRDAIDAASYIAVPGAANPTDQAGVQAAINAAYARGGGIVRVRKPISNGWNFDTLALYDSVILADERYSDSGHVVFHAHGADAELRFHGESIPGGEGPSVTLVNTATVGDRTTSLVSRSGPGAGGVAQMYMHMGVWTGSQWFPEFDMVTRGDDGFRSTLRVGYGTVQVNAAYPGADRYTQNKILTVNKPAPLGGGPLLEVGTTVTAVHGEMRIAAANSPFRHCAADGTIEWSWLSQYPSAGQLALVDHNTGTNKISFTSGGDTALIGALRPVGDNSDNLGGGGNRWAQVFAGTGTINTSDEREKAFAPEPDAAVLRAIARVDFRQFKFNDAIARKSEAEARWHFGVGAQQLKAAFEAEGLDPFAYGVLCYDEWDEEWVDHPAVYRDSAVLGTDGQPVKVLETAARREKTRDAGNRYGVRYDELFALKFATLTSSQN